MVCFSRGSAALDLHEKKTRRFSHDCTTRLHRFNTKRVPISFRHGYGRLRDGHGIGMDALLILLLLGGGNGGFGGFGNRGAGGPATIAIASDIVMQPAFQSLQNQISTLSGQFNNSEVQEAINGVSNQLGISTQAITQNQDNNARDTTAAMTAISNALENTRFTTLTSVNDLGRDVLQAGYQANLQNLNSFNVLNTGMLNGFNGLTSNFTNQINGLNLSNLTSFQTVNGGINQLSRDMAECCCEIKSTVRDSIDATHADGEATRALINALNVQNLQTQLADAKAQVSNLNQTNTLIANNASQTTTILTHLLPFLGFPTAAASTASARHAA